MAVEPRDGLVDGGIDEAGHVVQVDVVSGVQPDQLPGFTRGLAFIGEIAFVGLSQIRESSTFGELPLTRRLAEIQARD